MSTWSIILAALQAIPAIANALTELLALAGKIADELATQRALHEFEAARRLARENKGDVSELERLLGRRPRGL